MENIVENEIGESERQIFSVTISELLGFINERFSAKACGGCGKPGSVHVMTETNDMPVVVQYSLARNPKAGVWVFLISCDHCGLVSMIHTESVREWLYVPEGPAEGTDEVKNVQ